MLAAGSSTCLKLALCAGLEKKNKDLGEDLAGSRGEASNLTALNTELNVQVAGYICYIFYLLHVIHF